MPSFSVNLQCVACLTGAKKGGGGEEREKSAKEKREGSASHECLCFCIPFTHFLFNPITSTVNMRPITNRDVPRHGPNLIILFIPYPLSPTPLPFSLPPNPLPLSKPATQATSAYLCFFTVSGVGGCGCYIREWHDRWGSADKTFVRAWTWWTHTWRKKKGNCLLSLDTYVSINMANVANHDHKDL